MNIIHWVARRLAGLFPRWSHDELVSEIYLMYHTRMSRWDPTRGSLASFGLSTFRDPLTTRYLCDQGIRMRRKKGGAREYLYPQPHVDHPIHDPDPFEFPWHHLTQQEIGMVQMKARGISTTQISVVEGIAQSTASEMFKRISHKLY